MSNETVYKRIKASAIPNYMNQPICLIGRIDNVSDNRLVIDCGDMKVHIKSIKPSAEEVRVNDFIEARGEAISDNMLMAHGQNKINNDFNLTAYNKVIDLMGGCYDDYN